MNQDGHAGAGSTRERARGPSPGRAPLAVVIDGEGAFVFLDRGDADRQGAFLRTIRSGALIPAGLPELLWLCVRAGAAPQAWMPQPDADTRARLEAAFGGPGAVHPVAPTGPVVARTGSAGPLVGTAALVLATPVALRLSSAGFDHADHDGITRVRLDARELAAATVFTSPRSVAEAGAEQATRLGEWALSESEMAALAGRLHAAGLLLPAEPSRQSSFEARSLREYRHDLVQQNARREAVRRRLGELQTLEEERSRRGGRPRTRVVPVNREGIPIPSLGLCMAYAQAYDGGRLEEHYEFVPDWCDQTVPALSGEEPPGIYLFSNYIWSHAWNVARSAEVKARSPHSLTIHGGPNTPKYDDDVESYFRMNPQVDIAVHGEGEAAFAELLDALAGRVGHGPVDLSILGDVPGISFRRGDSIVRTGRRERIADLDTIPSPFRTGLFDSIGDSELPMMVVETNRGCPYGCTFCDWGSATLSRMRKFDLQRVFDDLEWCSKNRVKVIFCADSNFGMFSRDVEIARRVVELKRQYGYPKRFESSYAKNTVKHLREIIEIMAQGGVLSTGTLSLQSVDPETLATIRRSNIRVDRYDDLADEFSSNRLPLVVELMMGLPGSTLSSFLGDLQQCVDREVKARVNPTEVLMNSPMNDPDYRRENGIETLRPVRDDWSEDQATRRKALVISTATFSREDYGQMERYRRLFVLCENYAVLRHVSRYVRQEAGIPEIAFYGRLANDVAASPGRWPTIDFTFEAVTECMIPPVSWRFFVDEVRDYLVDHLGLKDDSALESVMRVQHALLPARDRAFPCRIELAHDYPTWYARMLDAKRRGYKRDWSGQVPRLASFGPATFEVDDPQALGRVGLGMPLFHDTDGEWELRSPVARVMQFRHLIHV